MAAVKVVGATVASFGIAYLCDNLIADQKIFGGKFLGYSFVGNNPLPPLTPPVRARSLNNCTTPKTVSNKEWWQETDKKFQAWPRTAGPPVVMNPISRQNFIVKSRSD
ncbi:hypothetical protein LIER_10825 [Lithospermum erythrorhizon]|uniref:Uncharacterized protein n=1 Tax=Lithospermum erythrorhizon TaxID=34254 RepID=A0AAV3PQ37_LITER